MVKELQLSNMTSMTSL